MKEEKDFVEETSADPSLQIGNTLFYKEKYK